MRIPRPPHNWAVSPKEAVAIQKRLASAVKQIRPARPIRYIAGVDAAFSPEDLFCTAGVVLWDVRAGEAVEQHTATRRLTFPYVPGLLSFREAPAIIAALPRLRRTPDGLMVDGHGIVHPRRCGIASHLGLIVGLPSIGCAKNRLIGSCRMPGEARGSRSPLCWPMRSSAPFCGLALRCNLFLSVSVMQ
jgi:deoxyribonuclease V